MLLIWFSSLETLPPARLCNSTEPEDSLSFVLIYANLAGECIAATRKRPGLPLRAAVAWFVWVVVIPFRAGPFPAFL